MYGMCCVKTIWYLRAMIRQVNHYHSGCSLFEPEHQKRFGMLRETVFAIYGLTFG